MARDITITTNDGTCPARLFGGGPSGVIIYMDAFGPRPALHSIAEEIAAEGYAVLVPDLYYRFGDYGGPFDARTTFANEETAARVRRMMGATTQALTQADTAFFLDALAEAGARGPAATVGYCMGGARSLNAAAAHPDRIVAAASLHGGNLASDAADSPHRNAGSIKARVYVGCAGVDKSFPPEQSALLAEALRNAEIDHLIENYVGMTHGWCVSDHGAHDAGGAARHMRRLKTFCAEALRPSA